MNLWILAVSCCSGLTLVWCVTSLCRQGAPRLLIWQRDAEIGSTGLGGFIELLSGLHNDTYFISLLYPSPPVLADGFCLFSSPV